MQIRGAARLLLSAPAGAGLIAGFVASCVGGHDGGSCEGSEGCRCYSNDTCDDGLSCLSKLCVEALTERDEARQSPDAGGGRSETAGAEPETASSSAPGSDALPTDAAGVDAEGTDLAGDSSVGGVGQDESATDADGQTAPETDLRLELVSADGWVDGSTNDVGIQGDWHTYGDDVSTYAPRSEPFFEGGSVCISGVVPPYAEEPDVWGAGLSLNINVAAPGQQPGAWDATVHDVRGFSFTLVGQNPPYVQVNYPVVGQADGTVYCVEERAVEPDTHTFSIDFEQTRYNCWEGEDGPHPDETKLRAFQVQVLPHDSEYVEFDFCLEDVAAQLVGVR